MKPFLICLALFAAQDQSPPAITALANTPDGKALIVGSQAGVVVQHPAGKQERIATTLDHVHALAFSADGKHLAIAGGSPAEKGVIEIWSWPEVKLSRKLEAPGDVIYDVAWLPDGLLASGGGDRIVRLWDVASGECRSRLQGHSGPVLALAASSDGKLLCSGSVDQTIRVWEPSTGKLLRSLNNHLGSVQGLAFRPSSSYLASVSDDGTLRLWQPAIGRLVRIVRHPKPVLSVAWSPDGSRVWSGGKDGIIRAIDGDSDQVIQEIKVEAGWATSLIHDRYGTSTGRVGSLTK